MLTYRYLCIKGIKGDMKALGPRFISQPRGTFLKNMNISFEFVVTNVEGEKICNIPREL
jgi:hypothetical protein